MEHRELWKANGEAIRHERLRLGLTQRELALRAGVDPRSISKAERGKLMFPTSLACIAAALGGGIDAYRLHAVAAERPPVLIQRQEAIARRLYEIYNTAVLSRDFDLLRRELPPHLSQGIVWTFVTSDRSSIDGKYVGVDGVREFLSEGLEISERERAMTVEEIRPVGADRLLVRCSDRILVRPFGGIISTSEVHLLTFDGNKVAQFHQSVQILDVTPVGKAAETPARRVEGS